MKRSIVIKRLGYEASAGWTTYGTSIADFHNFRAAQRDMKAPKKKVGQTGSLPIAVFNRAYGGAYWRSRQSRG